MMREKSKKRLGEILVEDGVLARNHLEEALDHQKEEGGLLGQILVRLGYITEEDLLAALGRQVNIPYMPLMNYSLTVETVQLFEERFCRRHMMVPFEKDEKRLFVAVVDPFNETAIEEAKKIFPNLAFHLFLSTPTEIMNVIDMSFNSNLGNNPLKKAG